MSKRQKVFNVKEASQADHHPYDHVLHGLVSTAIRKLCGLPPIGLEPFPTVIKKTKERRLDLVFKIKSGGSGLGGLIHVENQVKNDNDIGYRMAEYNILLSRETGMNVHPYLIYFGNDALTMQPLLELEYLTFRFIIVDLKAISAQPFLESDIPEEIVLAILCKFPDGKDAPEVIRVILDKLSKTKKYGYINYEQALQCLEILSNLRNLQPEAVKQISKMALTYDIRTDLRYLQGKEEGELKGIEKKEYDFVTALILKKTFSDEEISSLVGVQLAFVQRVKTELVSNLLLKQTLPDEEIASQIGVPLAFVRQVKTHRPHTLRHKPT